MALILLLENNQEIRYVVFMITRDCGCKVMDDIFKIYVDQLRNGHVEEISEVCPPDFLEINENELHFIAPVRFTGEAYLADINLVIQLAVTAEAVMPCLVCNDMVKVPIHIDPLYHMEPLKDIKTGIFHFKEILRDAIILEVPPYAECEQGHCPHRNEIAKYLHVPPVDSKREQSSKKIEEEGYRPFADLDWDNNLK